MNILKSTIRMGGVGVWLLCATTLLSTGCTITASQKTVALAPLAVSANAPTKSVVVYLRNISDDREFSIKSATPVTQSVETVDALADIETGSVIGQWRTANTVVLADLLLEDANQVSALVSSAVEEAFRRAGYKVVSADRAESESAVPIDGQIHRFWAYQTGSWTFRFTFEIDIGLQADVAGLEDGRRIESSEFLRSAVASSPNSFANTINLGVEKFIEALADQLR